MPGAWQVRPSSGLALGSPLPAAVVALGGFLDDLQEFPTSPAERRRKRPKAGTRGISKMMSGGGGTRDGQIFSEKRMSSFTHHSLRSLLTISHLTLLAVAGRQARVVIQGVRRSADAAVNAAFRVDSRQSIQARAISGGGWRQPDGQHPDESRPHKLEAIGDYDPPLSGQIRTWPKHGSIKVIQRAKLSGNSRRYVVRHPHKA